MIMPKKKKIAFGKLDIKKQISLVNKALEKNVYTALAMHDGGLEIMDIDGYKVYIRYYGACGTCPMAETSTLMFVENTLKEEVDKKIQVKIA